MKTTKSVLLVCTSLLLLAFSNHTFAANRTWTGSVSVDWDNPQNWAENSVPTEDDSVIINGFVTHQPTLDLSGGPVTIASLSIGATADSTLNVAFGDTETNRLIVNGDVHIGPKGVLTHENNAAAATYLHKLFLEVGSDLTVDSGGQIQAVRKKYGGLGGGDFPSYGGQCSVACFGSFTRPTHLGSSRQATNNSAGGAIRIIVGGTLSNNGVINCNFGGSRATGGSVWIETDILTGSGNITANGCNNASGGTIALYYSDRSTFSGQVLATGATGGTIYEKPSGSTKGFL
ncbi:MAG: hypothetical protein GX811_01705 [Lentisphaerae bacterium]|nr:hypothetical protein [Lentisphaerota bacterium]